MKHISMFARRAAALLLAAVLLVGAIPAAFAEEEGTPEGEAVTEAVYTVPTTIGGADTTLLPAEEENCLSWLFGSKDTITMPYLNIKGKGLRRNVKLNLVDCLVGITYTELGSIGSFVSASAAQEAWKAQAVAIHSYLEYHKKYADLQIDLTGGEGWGYTNLPGEEAGEFTGDIGFRTSPDAVSGTLGEGRFVLFFPGELHKPGVARPGCAHVRKVVIKIRMED